MRWHGFFAGILLLAGLLLCSVATVAEAEFKPLSPFAATEVVPPSAFRPPSAAPFQAPGPFGRLFAWVFEQQQRLQRTLAASVKSLKTDNPLAGAFTLAGLSFLYGILHAVGPGHGKTIISSYVVANEETVRRGILISFIASALQAFTAVALVGVLLIGLGASGLQVNAWSSQLESMSYALIALVGLYLLWTQIVRLWRRRFGDDQAAEAGHGHGEHGHDHHHHVLVFALTQGLFWAGVAATFAMAFGTAITVAALATLALGSRELALKLGGANAAWANAVWTTCAIGGAVIIFLFGLLLFLASLGPARPF